MKKITALLLAVLMLVTITGCKGKSNNPNVNPDHGLIALKSENFEITNGMLSYLYLYGFYNVYGNYQSYFQSMGFDATKPLNEQQYAEDMTWHDYFLEMTLTDARNFLRVAEAAKEAGCSDDYLEKAVQDEIDKMIKNEGVTLAEYITKMFGDNVGEDDLRKALSLQIYAYDYYEQLQEEIGEGITTEECEAYYTENFKSLSKVDYISYTITANTANTSDTEGAYALAKQKAEELVEEAKSNGVEGFKSWVTVYMTEQNKISTAPMEEDALNSQIEKVLAGTLDAGYTEGNELSEFCFEDGRAVGDCKLTDNGAGSYTVTIITATPHRLDAGTRDVRHILFRPENYGSSEAAAKEKAEEVLAEWKKGEATVESFDALADEHNDDGSSLYENVRIGEMVQPFNDWLFDESRQVGDTGIVMTDYGYHIMYFVGDSYPVWEVEVRDTLTNAELGTVMSGFEETYAINETKENIDKLPVTLPQGALETDTAAVATGTNVY